MPRPAAIGALPGEVGRAYPFVTDLQSQLGDWLRYVFRTCPLTHVHPHAQYAAEAAEAEACRMPHDPPGVC